MAETNVFLRSAQATARRGFDYSGKNENVDGKVEEEEGPLTHELMHAGCSFRKVLYRCLL